MAAELVSGGLFLPEIRFARVLNPVSQNRCGPVGGQFPVTPLPAGMPAIRSLPHSAAKRLPTWHYALQHAGIEVI